MNSIIEVHDYIPGMKITEPGAYRGVPMSIYHGQCCDAPSVSSSGLRDIAGESLAHFWLHTSLNPNRVEKADTEAMILGRAAHHSLLGEGDFKKFFVKKPDTYTDAKTGEEKKWNGNAHVCQRWIAEQALAGLSVITDKQLEQIVGMADSLANEPMVQGGILRGHVELSMFWFDNETGIWLKARPDAVPIDASDYFDMKCVADIFDAGVNRSLSDRGYHQQGALVGEVHRNLTGSPMDNFSLVFVEQDKPHCVRIEAIYPDDLHLGEDTNRAALRLLRKALDTNYWPGPKNRDGDGGFCRISQRSREWLEHRLSQMNKDIAA